MFFANAEELLLEREMMKYVQQLSSGDADKDKQVLGDKKEHEVRAIENKESKQESKVSEGTGEESEIDWENDFAAMMNQGFGGEASDFIQQQEDDVGQCKEDEKSGINQLKVKWSGGSHNQELAQYEQKDNSQQEGEEDEGEEEDSHAKQQMDCLDKEEDLVPLDKEAQKEFFRQIRSNYLNSWNNVSEQQQNPAKANNSKHNHHGHGTKIQKNHQAHENHKDNSTEKIQTNQNNEKYLSEGNSNLPRSLLPDDFKPLTRESYDKEKENEKAQDEDNQNEEGGQCENGDDNDDDDYYNQEDDSNDDEEANEEGTTEDERKEEKAVVEEGMKEVSREYLQTNKWDCKEFKVVYSNGDVYEGETDKDTGLKDGWGLYIYANGEKYEGFFQDDIIHGYGRYWFLGGHHYEGDWKDGMKHGIGQLHFSTGDRYSGFFSNDNFHGEGEYFYKNGDKFQGTFITGKKHGPGKFMGSNGRKIIGEWLEDELQHF